MQLDSQRLQQVQEELEKRKAERLADSLQKRMQVLPPASHTRLLPFTL